MKKINFISSSGSGTVINYGSGPDFLTSYGSGSGSTGQKFTVPTVPVPVPQRWRGVKVFHLAVTQYSRVLLILLIVGFSSVPLRCDLIMRRVNIRVV